jgi:hypothetical protein
MATSKKTSPAPTRQQQAATNPMHEGKPIALTVKVDDQTYIRLRTLGATRRRTNQAILLETVRQYLDRTKA